jgi:mono/diheme cytochrome c family protein
MNDRSGRVLPGRTVSKSLETEMTAAFIRTAASLILLGAIAMPIVASAQGADAERVKRGEYIFRAADCYSCHTDTKNNGQPLAGGAAIKTPFGTFYPPNITPDTEFGIGLWSDQDFLRALRDGIAPDGSHYYPAFPYTSFTGMTNQDILDLKAYIFTLPAVSAEAPQHELPFYLRWRSVIGAWKMLNFKPGPMTPDPAKDAVWNRGRYLVEAIAHCGECHSPRTATGAIDRAKEMSGNPSGPDGKGIPNITPDPTGIGDWSESDLAFALKLGVMPDGDTFGSFMADVVEQGTAYLTDDDRTAIARYIRSLPPVRTEKEDKPKD